MWTTLIKRASSKNFNLSSHLPRFSLQIPISHELLLAPFQTQSPFHGSNQDVNFTSLNQLGRSNFMFSQYPFDFSPFCFNNMVKSFRGYASVAEAIESEDDYSSSDSIDGIHKLLEEEMVKEEKVKHNNNQHSQNQNLQNNSYKYKMLRKRQIKIETEAWEEAAREYQEMLDDMREHKLAPNLPYVKSLFLGWFEPFRDAIAADQDRCKEIRLRLSHAPYFNELPPDMMAVITMHKLMGLLMTSSNGVGSARVIQVASQIGEAIEHERSEFPLLHMGQARIYRFMEETKKTKEKRSTTVNPDGESDLEPKERDKLIEQKEKMVNDQKRLRKKVASLIKKQKKQQAMGIVRGLDDRKPWGQEGQVKVGSRLVQLLIETAYIQPPPNQSADSPPDIHPAFKHSLKTISSQAHGHPLHANVGATY
ncbi:hypothetical protein Lal_00012117 [Lupinus albus]|nr:hypothetical protein Lal_00012117 [Lupinus albus]